MSINLIKGPGFCYFVGTDGNQYGLTLQGFVPIPMTQFVALLQQDFQAAFGQEIDLSANAPDGQQIAIMAEALTLVTELDKAGYDSRFPDTAQGQSLANVASITNFIPEPPAASTITGEVVTGTPGTVIPDSFQIAVNGAPASIFQVNSGQFYTIGAGGTVNINMTATQTGPIAAPEGSATVIVTPVAGIASVTNPNPAALGSNLETETQIRQRRILTLAQPGPNLDQIISALLETPGVTNAGGSENDTDFTANGLPPHSVALLVQGTATSLQIATTIYKTKSAGIQTSGNTSIVIFNSQSQPVTISFSSPSLIQTYYDFTYVAATNPLDGIFPNNGAAAIISAALTYLSLQVVGQDVVLNQLSQYICEQVPGIVGLTIKAGTAPSPAGTSNLSMLFNQLAISQANQMAAHT